MSVSGYEVDPAYIKRLDYVASMLYSLDFHFCRWEDATVREKRKYVQKAHLAKVWWGVAESISYDGDGPAAPENPAKPILPNGLASHSKGR